MSQKGRNKVGRSPESKHIMQMKLYSTTGLETDRQTEPKTDRQRQTDRQTRGGDIA